MDFGPQLFLYLCNMEQKILSLNYGQIILYGYLTNSIYAQRGFDLTLEDISKIIDIIVETTNPEFYEDDVFECPDTEIMMYPQKSFQIFCDWYDENETLIVDNLLTTV